MICSLCGGNVEWQGKFSNLTHTLCLECGALNAQVIEDVLDIEDTEDLEPEK